MTEAVTFSKSFCIRQSILRARVLLVLKDKVPDLWYHGLQVVYKRFTSVSRLTRVLPEFLLDKFWEQSYAPSLTLKLKKQDRIYIYCEGGYKDAADHADQRAHALGQDDAHPKPSTDSDALRNATPQSAYRVPFCSQINSVRRETSKNQRKLSSNVALFVFSKFGPII